MNKGDLGDVIWIRGVRVELTKMSVWHAFVVNLVNFIRNVYVACH